jgi:hypothetical protein
MGARLIRPFQVRLDVRTGKAEMARPGGASANGAGAPRGPSPQKSPDAGAIKVQRDDRPIADERREPSLAPPPKSADAGSIKVQRDDKAIVEARRELSLSPPPKSAYQSSIRVQRGDKAGGEERREPSLTAPPKSTNGSVKVQRDDRPIAEERRKPSLSPMSAGSAPIQAVRDDKAGTDEYADPPLPQHTELSDDGSSGALHDDKSVSEERRAPSLSPTQENAEDGATEAPRNDKIVIEDLEREHQFRMAVGLMAKARTRVDADERLDTKTIIRLASAVIVVGLGFTALLPSILTRDPAQATLTLTTPPAPAPTAPAQPEQASVAQPAAAPPASPPQPVQAAPTPNDVASNAKSTPALRGSSAPAAQGEARATTQLLGPNTGNDGGLTLTAAEKAAVTRGLQELEKRAAVTPPPRPRAPARPPLTDEEKAAIERGLRELEKTAGQGKP